LANDGEVSVPHHVDEPDPVTQLAETISFLTALKAQLEDCPDSAELEIDRYGLLVPLILARGGTKRERESARREIEGYRAMQTTVVRGALIVLHSLLLEHDNSVSAELALGD